MQSLSPEQYAGLRRLAATWQRRQEAQPPEAPRGNPRLRVDALCFQRLPAAERDDYLIGALITPLSLSLVLVPARFEAAPSPPEAAARRAFTLPSGRYPFTLERLEDATWLWRCELLDDLSDLESMQEASRLAQRLMDQVMTPEA